MQQFSDSQSLLQPAIQPTPLTPFQALRRSLWMVVQAAPRELGNLALINLVTGAGPSLGLVLSKVVIDEATRLLGTAPDNPIALVLNQPTLLWSMVAVVVLNLFVDSIDSLGAPLFAALRDRVQGDVRGRVLQKIATFDDIALFETPDLLNLVQLTEKGIGRLQRLSMIVAGTLVGISIFVPSVTVSTSVAWWVPLVLLGSSAPSIFVEIKYHRRSWRVEKNQAGLTREMDIYSRMLTDEAYAKEIRLFSLQSILLDRWRDKFTYMFRMMQQVRLEGATVVILWAWLSGLAAALPYVYVVMGVLQGIYTLGDLALYTGIIQQVRRSLFVLINNLGDIYDVALATSPIFQLLDLEPNLRSGTDEMRKSPALTSGLSSGLSSGSIALPSSPGLQLRNVSFAYPGSDKPTLRQIDLTIAPGEMVALVGENGAGKTTLAKLLCRLYDPTQGQILWNGQDLHSLNLRQLRSKMAVVMQDYARFPATLRENVGWGYVPELANDKTVQTVLAEAGIASLRTTLSQGLDTPLGKQLEQGVDLSGGQWQRIAIARALLRLSEVELLVFDEPTAALDPKNEHEIYAIFQTIARDRMAVVVSHRLALARMADRIVVLEQGQIVEMGSHDELMAAGDRYCTMFTRQASSYR